MHAPHNRSPTVMYIACFNMSKSFPIHQPPNALLKNRIALWDRLYSRSFSYHQRRLTDREIDPTDSLNGLLSSSTNRVRPDHRVVAFCMSQTDNGPTSMRNSRSVAEATR